MLKLALVASVAALLAGQSCLAQTSSRVATPLAGWIKYASAPVVKDPRAWLSELPAPARGRQLDGWDYAKACDVVMSLPDPPKGVSLDETQAGRWVMAQAKMELSKSQTDSFGRICDMYIGGRLLAFKMILGKEDYRVNPFPQGTKNVVETYDLSRWVMKEEVAHNQTDTEESKLGRVELAMTRAGVRPDDRDVARGVINIARFGFLRGAEVALKHLDDAKTVIASK